MATIHFAEKTTQTELARRSNAGIDVTLLWVRHDESDEVLVCVCDRCEGAHFEILAAPHLALEAYYHPLVYREFSTVDYVDSAARGLIGRRETVNARIPGSIARGVDAAAIGMLAMDTPLYRRCRSGGGQSSALFAPVPSLEGFANVTAVSYVIDSIPGAVS